MPLRSALLLLGSRDSGCFAGPTCKASVTYPLSPTDRVTCTASLGGAAASEAGLPPVPCCCWAATEQASTVSSLDEKSCMQSAYGELYPIQPAAVPLPRFDAIDFMHVLQHTQRRQQDAGLSCQVYHSHCRCARLENKLLCTFASVRSLPYFLPDAPSTILARQGPMSCCGVNAISLFELLLLQVHGEQLLEVCLHAHLDNKKCKQTAEWCIVAIG